MQHRDTVGGSADEDQRRIPRQVHLLNEEQDLRFMWDRFLSQDQQGELEPQLQNDSKSKLSPSLL